MLRPSHISALHVERGVQMRTLVQDSVRSGLSLEASLDSLASYLGIEVESVKLAIAIANEWA